MLRYDDPTAAVEWLCRVFRFREHVRLSASDGSVNVAELEGPGGGWLMVGGSAAYRERLRSKLEGYREQLERPWPNLSHSTTVLVDDVDAHYEHTKASGATVLVKPTDQPWGIREYEALDLEGHLWNFGKRLHEAEPEQWGAERLDTA
jgi:uncharacterized glyoxalase superfamily protein PhnB